MSELDQGITDRHQVVRVIRRSWMTRPFALAAPVALLLLVSACGSDTATPTATPGASEPAPTTTGDPSGGAAGSVLTGTVGEGDAFTITLTDGTGAPVTTLPAGSYEVKVKDASKMHNFHLTGPGVEEKTTVPEVADATWMVTFAAGTYTFKCDPHPPMTGSFTVT